MKPYPAAIVVAIAGLAAAGGYSRLSPGAAAQPGAQAAAAIPPPSTGQTLQVADLYHLRSIGDVQLSPDGSSVAYGVVNNDRRGRPYSQVWVMNLSSRAANRLGGSGGSASTPRWSPDGKSIAYIGGDAQRFGLFIASADGSQPRFVAPIQDTNHPLPSSGDQLTWSPDAKRIAFVSATPGPEQDANGDPMVITRYLYKPTASEGLTRFNDNRRLHIFIADLAAGTVKQLTTGDHYEHSLDWSPAGDRILFVSNHEPDPDRFFNYDIFTVRVGDGAIAQLTQTKSAEYHPVWSPDGKRIAYSGTTRSLTSSETTMEDTHVWVTNADGSDRHSLGDSLDNRQGPPRWSGDSRTIYFSLQEKGQTHLYKVPAAGGRAELALGDTGSIGSWSRTDQGGSWTLAYALATPAGPSELYVAKSVSAPVAVTTLNRALLNGRKIAGVESFTFASFDGTPIEAFLTKPTDIPAGSRHPLIVMMHGGPHGQQGPEFNAKAQIYAAHGWASLMVNYRGSTGYGQKLTDAIFADQDGGEAKDVVAGVDAALKRYAWLDGQRMGLEGGSYGGQLANWIITQTDRFAAAIPTAGISNLVTQNYLSYYHDYLAVEYGGFPHQNGIIDKLWERSAIRYANRVKTPTMFVHGENDNDVPIAEAEQFYIALRDVGVETVMIRYPREGHGVRETAHVIDSIERSIAWYDRHFQHPTPATR